MDKVFQRQQHGASKSIGSNVGFIKRTHVSEMAVHGWSSAIVLDWIRARSAEFEGDNK